MGSQPNDAVAPHGSHPSTYTAAQLHLPQRQCPVADEIRGGLMGVVGSAFQPPTQALTTQPPAAWTVAAVTGGPPADSNITANM
jgi:hypothetical protein